MKTQHNLLLQHLNNPNEKRSCLKYLKNNFSPLHISDTMFIQAYRYKLLSICLFHDFSQVVQSITIVKSYYITVDLFFKF